MNSITKKEAHFSFSIALILALIFVFIFILPLVACPLWGQVVQKKTLTENDYPKFGELDFDTVSSDGRWASCTMVYKNGLDTLFVKNTSSQKSYCFPLGAHARFLGNNRFIYENTNGLHLFNLNNGSQQDLGFLNRYSLTAQKQLIILTQENSKSRLLIMDRNGSIINVIDNLSQFILSPDGQKMLFAVHTQEGNSLGILSFKKPNLPIWIMKKNPGNFKMLTWEKTAKALAFVTSDNFDPEKNSLYYYSTDDNLLHQLDPEKQADFPADKIIDNSGEYAITISEDLTVVFFGVALKDNLKAAKYLTETESKVEIWNGNAKWIYPMEKSMGQFDKRVHLAVWYPFSGRFSPITSPDLPKVMLNGNKKYAILSNPQAYEPQFDYEGPRDFFIMDPATGQKDLVLQNQSITAAGTMPEASPGGRYLIYFRNKNWWVYDLRSKIHTNVTKKMSSPIIGHVQTLYRDKPYGIAGWTSGDKEIILYDQYDLWVVKPDGTKYTRITRGHEKQIQFRLFKADYLDGLEQTYDGWIGKTVSLSKRLLLEARGDDGKTGYFKWEHNVGEMPIVYKGSFIDKLHEADNGKKFIYQQQQFDSPPSLILKQGKTTLKFYQSSAHQSAYQWGSAELITYRNSKGEKLNAVLNYPADYNPEKKYPMIVNMYEKHIQKLHKYISPTLENSAGFNPAVLTAQGYFILYPDMAYEDGFEGSSALDCTVQAVKKIVTKGLVNPDKIGIIGHSFGGYESSYIITQTDIFAAAIAGSAITDIMSYYLSINWELGRPTMNYFANNHFKMIDSPYEIPEAYNRNSPLLYADKIRTPLLLYTGREDYHVNWNQSVELYMAMRRLNKKQMLLLYPNEAHSIIDPVNKLDLTKRVSQWFGYYLKDENPAQWIVDGMK